MTRQTRVRNTGISSPYALRVVGLNGAIIRFAALLMSPCAECDETRGSPYDWARDTRPHAADYRASRRNAWWSYPVHPHWRWATDDHSEACRHRCKMLVAVSDGWMRIQSEYLTITNLPTLSR